jgi:hypothetical protein
MVKLRDLDSSELVNPEYVGKILSNKVSEEKIENLKSWFLNHGYAVDTLGYYHMKDKSTGSSFRIKIQGNFLCYEVDVLNGNSYEWRTFRKDFIDNVVITDKGNLRVIK